MRPGSLPVRRAPGNLGIPLGKQVLPHQCDWWVPKQAPSGLIWLQHGFGRSGASMAALAASLAGAGFLVLAPSLASLPSVHPRQWRAVAARATLNRVLDNRQFLTAVADLLVGVTAPGCNPHPRHPLLASLSQALAGAAAPAWPGRAVLVGHSAGAEAIALVGARMVEQGAPPAAVVLLDPVASPRGDNLAVGLAGLAEQPVRVVAAEPSRCNRSGSGTEAVRRRRAGLVGVRLVGGRHTDAEGQSSDWLGRRSCGEPDPANFAALSELTSGWAHRAVAGTLVASADLADPIVDAGLAQNTMVGRLTRSDKVEVITGSKAINRH